MPNPQPFLALAGPRPLQGSARDIGVLQHHHRVRPADGRAVNPLLRCGEGESPCHNRGQRQALVRVEAAPPSCGQERLTREPPLRPDELGAGT